MILLKLTLFNVVVYRNWPGFFATTQPHYVWSHFQVNRWTKKLMVTAQIESLENIRNANIFFQLLYSNSKESVFWIWSTYHSFCFARTRKIQIVYKSVFSRHRKLCVQRMLKTWRKELLCQRWMDFLNQGSIITRGIWKSHKFVTPWTHINF